MGILDYINEQSRNLSTGNRLKIITDEPTLEHALDFNNYSRRLADIIVSSNPRFVIGVFGGWGTGKTSLMLMIKKNLKITKKYCLYGLMRGDMKGKRI
jgi:predicted KAP-like P-loop ATPase